MTVEVTREMRLAMDLLGRAGVEFHPTAQKVLPCGCFVLGGWVIASKEIGIRVRHCSPEHELAYGRAEERWEDPDVSARFYDVDAVVAMAELLTEEIG